MLLIQLSVYALFTFLISDTFSTCPVPNGSETVVEMCHHGEGAGKEIRLLIQTSGTSTGNCSCDVELYGGKIRYMEYRGTNSKECGLQLTHNNIVLPLNCSGANIDEQNISRINYFPTNSPAGDSCLIIKTANNSTVTCYPADAAPIKTSTSTISPEKSIFTTTARVSSSGSTSAAESTLSTPGSTATPRYASTFTAIQRGQTTGLNGQENGRQHGPLSLVVGISVGGTCLVLIGAALVIAVRHFRKRNRKVESNRTMIENAIYGAGQGLPEDRPVGGGDRSLSGIYMDIGDYADITFDKGN